MSELEGWKDLPEGLLRSIVGRLGLGSAPELLAFATTCQSWASAFSDFIATVPPLLLHPDVSLLSPCRGPFSVNRDPKCPCRVTDITKPNQDQDAYLCNAIPLLGSLERFSFTGASYGQLILSNGYSCDIFDLFRGVVVSPPQLTVFKSTKLIYGALTAPLILPNSYLIVDTGEDYLFWCVGSDSWVRCSTQYGTIKQIVVFKRQVFGMDSDRRLFKVHLTPEISIHELTVMQSSMISKCQLSNAWLVACGDMLLLVGFRGPAAVSSVTLEVFRLDQSTEPASWLKVEKLESWAIFISTDKRSQALCCKNPEVWGGRSNCIYCYSPVSKRWTAVEIGKPLQGDDPESNSNIFTGKDYDSKMKPCVFSPASSLCVWDGDDDAWLMYLMQSGLCCNGV